MSLNLAQPHWLLLLLVLATQEPKNPKRHFNLEYVDPCNCGMERPGVAGGGEGPQIWMVAANKILKLGG